MTEAPPDAGTLLAELLALPAERRLAHLRGVGEPEALLLALGEAADGLAAVEVGRALAASEMVVAVADEAGRPLAQADARRAHAMVLANAGRLEESLRVSERGIAIAEAAGLTVAAARARLASVHALARLGRHERAVAAGETARAALVAANEGALAARADLSLGAVHHERDDPTAALAHYDRARRGLADDPIATAQLETNRGNALMSLDAFASAEAAFLAAVDAFTAHGLGWAAAIAEGNLAYLATRQGRLEHALHRFERARRALEGDESPADLARLLAEQADAVALLGLPADALATYERVLPELERHGLAAEAAHARLGRGRSLLRLGRLTEAEPALAAAAAGFDGLGMAPARARVDLIRAELAAAAGRPEEARTLLNGALAVLHDRPAEAILGRYRLARLALAAGDYADADAELATGLATAESLDLAPALADLLHLRGVLRGAEGRPDLALADLRAAVGQVERVRGTLQAERFRAAFLGNRLALYEALVVAALDQGDPAAPTEAFAVVEQAKSRALLDLVGGALDLSAAADREGEDPADAALLAELARLRNGLNWRYSRLGDEERGARGGQGSGDQLRAIHDQERELDALRDRIAVARGIAGLFAPPLDLASALAVLPAGTALIEYFTAGDETLAFVLRDGQARVVRDLGSPAELAERARRFRFQIGRALGGGDRAEGGARGDRLLADVRRELVALHARLLAPLGDALDGVGRLVVVPHGALHTLPFHALWDGERHLIERCEVVFAPSASLLARLGVADAAPIDTADALVVGVPDAVAPRIGEEAERVARTLGTDRLLLGDAATVERVTAAVRDAGVVHLACHGRFAPESPLGSGLKVADGWITARDVYALKLRASLVTLSGCETGRAAIAAGDELLGLVRAFFAAGAASLILSLWIVDDEGTADLMAGFYDAWRRGLSKPAALRAAQRSLLARRPHPAFWAPFILGGQP